LRIAWTIVRHCRSATRVCTGSPLITTMSAESKLARIRAGLTGHKELVGEHRRSGNGT
jgi:hypothetical protein